MSKPEVSLKKKLRWALLGYGRYWRKSLNRFNSYFIFYFITLAIVWFVFPSLLALITLGRLRLNIEIVNLILSFAVALATLVVLRHDVIEKGRLTTIAPEEEKEEFLSANKSLFIRRPPKFGYYSIAFSALLINDSSYTVLFHGFKTRYYRFLPSNPLPVWVSAEFPRFPYVEPDEELKYMYDFPIPPKSQQPIRIKVNLEPFNFEDDERFFDILKDTKGLRVSLRYRYTLLGRSCNKVLDFDIDLRGLNYSKNFSSYSEA